MADDSQRDGTGPAVTRKRHIARAFWTLADQGIVSLGTFLSNVLLARNLAAAEYGTYALVFGSLLTLQLIMSSLVHYPVSVRRSVAEPWRRGGLMTASLGLSLMFSVPLGLVVGIVIWFFGRPELIIPIIGFFTCWQLQETARRSILAEFRLRTAMIGDAACYLGQVVILFGLIFAEKVSLEAVFTSMALLFAGGALLQTLQTGVGRCTVVSFLATARDFWSIGRWSLSSNVVSSLQYQTLPVVLAYLHGPAAAGMLHACANVVNMTNPVVIGLTNIIPPTVAQAAQHGIVPAWRSARHYAILGMFPLLLAYGIAFVNPEVILRLIYGYDSPFIQLGTAIQILVLGTALGYASDIVCAFLNGINRPQATFAVNASGSLTVVLLAVPLLAAYGVMGVGVAVAGVNFVRLISSQILLSRAISNGAFRPA